MSKDIEESRELVLYLADSTLACGLQYGLWVERAPSTEEQVALSSMSQDKLGHARAFYQLAEEVTGRSVVELQFDRKVEAFRWNPAWAAALPSWHHVVLAQAVFGPGLMLELEALAQGSRLREPLGKVQQEEAWHERHASAWVEHAAGLDRGPLEEAFEDLWPFVVAFFGASGEERFPEDVASGVREGDDVLRGRFLDEVVPRLESAGVEVPAKRSKDGSWSLSPAPDADLVGMVRERAWEHGVELVGLLQDPEGRELAELA